MDEHNQVGHPKAASGFEEFLLAEYNNIAKAHFTAIDTISTFFKNYLLIVSLPVSVVVLLFETASKNSSSSIRDLGVPPTLIMLLATAIGAVGWAVMAYIINLRLEALLYARTVNGIRLYFAERSGVERVERYMLLPRDINQPGYVELEMAIAKCTSGGADAFLDLVMQSQGFSCTPSGSLRQGTS